MADDQEAKPAAPPPPAKPKSVSDVLPTSLQVAGWTIPIVIGLVGVVKTVTDMTIAAQQEVRARANAEIAFFDKQYDYATKMGLDEKAQPLLKASVDALLSRREPDFYVNRMFDWALHKQRDQALFLVCAARKTALDTYDSGAVAKASDYFRQRWSLFADLAPRSKKGSAADLLVSYDTHCKLALASPEEAAGPVVSQAPLAEAAPHVAPALRPAPSRPAVAPAPVTLPAYRPGPAPPPPVAAAAPTGDCAEPPANLPDPPNAAPTAQSHQGAPGGWDLDIFWCAHPDPARARANYQTACHAYVTLAGRPEVGGETLGRVRLRRMPVALQTGHGYPSSGTMISYDLGQASEQLLSDQIGQLVWPGRYKVQPGTRGTRWYMSLYACGPN